MRVDVVRCASCNTIVPAPTARSRKTTCESCIAKQRRAAFAKMPKRHHVPVKDDDEDDSLLDHWPC